jgi:hypothetical protein
MWEKNNILSYHHVWLVSQSHLLSSLLAQILSSGSCLTDCLWKLNECTSQEIMMAAGQATIKKASLLHRVCWTVFFSWKRGQNLPASHLWFPFKVGKSPLFSTGDLMYGAAQP